VTRVKHTIVRRNQAQVREQVLYLSTAIEHGSIHMKWVDPTRYAVATLER